MSKVSPQIFEAPRNQTALKGSAVNFTCKANGLPKPRVWWKFNDGNLSSNAIQHDIQNGSLLLLQNLTKDMGGKYQCVAENIKNVTASTATLTVLGKYKNNTTLMTEYLVAGECLVGTGRRLLTSWLITEPGDYNLRVL